MAARLASVWTQLVLAQASVYSGAILLCPCVFLYNVYMYVLSNCKLVYLFVSVCLSDLT